LATKPPPLKRRPPTGSGAHRPHCCSQGLRPALNQSPRRPAPGRLHPRGVVSLGGWHCSGYSSAPAPPCLRPAAAGRSAPKRRARSRTPKAARLRQTIAGQAEDRLVTGRARQAERRLGPHHPPVRQTRPDTAASLRWLGDSLPTPAADLAVCCPSPAVGREAQSRRHPDAPARALGTRARSPGDTRSARRQARRGARRTSAGATARVRLSDPIAWC
jgi:hypothetical protein